MDRGDIWHVDLNPTKGREQQGPRYVLILTKREVNSFSPPLVAPITSGGNFAREKGFTVSLMGTGLNTTGVVLCNQVRALDLRARSAQFREKAPDFIVDDVLAKIAALLD